MISPPSFCGACLNFSREKDSVAHFFLVDREGELYVHSRPTCYDDWITVS